MTGPVSWFRVDVEGWPVIADSLNPPWPDAAIVADLAWWADRERMGRAKRPGRGALRVRWGVTDWKAKMMLRESPTASEPPADRQPTASRPPAAARANLENGTETASRPPADRQATASEPPRARSRQRTEDRGQTQDTPPSPPAGGVPAWVRLEARKVPGLDPADLHASVVRILDAIRESPCDPQRCGSEGRQITTHFRSLRKLDGCSLQEFEADALLVASAFQQCPDGLFARDVRGEGRDDMVDRRHSVSTFCVARRWGDRVRAAKRWGHRTEEQAIFVHPEDARKPPDQQRMVPYSFFTRRP